MNQNQNTEVKNLNPEAIASSTELPVKELVPAAQATASAEPKSKKAKKNKAAKAKLAAKEATSATPEAKAKKNTKAPEETETKVLKLKNKKSAKDRAVAETAEQQKPSIIEEVISHRDVKYLYPEDCLDTLSRKTWRQKTRNKLRKLERDMLRISDQNSKEYKKAKKAYEEYQTEVLKINQAV